jgi:hypothetical protein
MTRVFVEALWVVLPFLLGAFLGLAWLWTTTGCVPQ